MLFNYVQKGQQLEIPTAAFHNAVVDILRQQFGGRGGLSDKTGNYLTQNIARRRQIKVITADNISPYSIFTVDAGDGYECDFPRATSLQITDETTEQIYVVNQDRSLGIGNVYTCDILGDSEARLVSYDPSDGVPSAGTIIGPKPNTYLVSVAKTGLIAVSEADTINNRVWALRNYRSGSTTVEGGNIVLLRAISCFNPGTSGTFDLWSYDADLTAWIDSGSDVVANDVLGRVFMLPGEFIWAVVSTGDGTATATISYDLIGPYGLVRKAKTVDEIACGQEGEAVIWDTPLGTGSGTGTATECGAEESNCTVSVCHFWSDWDRLIKADEKIIIEYFEGTWRIRKTQRPRMVRALLGADLDSTDESVFVSSPFFMDYCYSEAITSARNDLNLCGNEGDDIVLYYDESVYDYVLLFVARCVRTRNALATLNQDMCSDDTGAISIALTNFMDGSSTENPTQAYNTLGLAGKSGEVIKIEKDLTDGDWHIIQVLHKLEDVAVEDNDEQSLYPDQFINYHDCVIHGHVRKKAAIMSCDNRGWYDQIQLVQRNFVREISATVGQDGCPAIGAIEDSACMFDPEGLDPIEPTPFLSLVQVLVVEDFTDDGECIKAVTRLVCVAGAAENTAEIDVFCTVDCLPGTATATATASGTP